MSDTELKSNRSSKDRGFQDSPDDTIGLLVSEVRRISTMLADLARQHSPQKQDKDASENNNALRIGEIARAFIKLRRLREKLFPHDLFADPAWDMLLELYAAKLEGKTVAVSSLCLASAVTPTTALRWIKTMSDGGLFRRVADENDGRRVFIELTDVAEAGMAAYFAEAQSIASTFK